VDNKHRKSFVFSNQNGANLCLKCTTIRLDPLGELIHSPDSLRAPTSTGMGGRGPTSKGGGSEERGGNGTGRAGSEFQSQGESALLNLYSVRNVSPNVEQRGHAAVMGKSFQLDQ